MNNYLLLVNPGHNRVYFEQSKKLSVSELQIVLPKLSVKCIEVKAIYIADVFYLTFCSDKSLDNHDIGILSKLSFVYAIFEMKEIDDEKLLLPISRNNVQYMDSSISSILKYTGKTNEIFTRMMLNIALFSSDFNDTPSIKLLDPIAGKGTTLFEGLIYGFDVYGIEIGDKAVNETYHYLKKYLETEKYKHNAKTEKFSGENKSFIAIRYIFEIAKTKDEMKSKQKKFEIIAGNSVYANKFYKKNSFHLIVGDLPYGVQHGNVTNEKQSSLTRNPKELLLACLGNWKDTLMPGGVIVLAWNKFVLPRDEMIQIFKNTGLFVLNEGVYLEFEHRVDQSIKRDIIVAKKL